MQLKKLQKFLYETVHRSKKPVAEIATKLGISENYLYRIVALTEPSSTNFPLHFLIPLMKITKNYSVLKYIASECRFICARIPNVPRNRLEDTDMVYYYQNQTIRGVETLLKFIKKQTLTNKKMAIEELRRTIEETAGILKRLENWGQLEIWEEQ